MTDTAKSAKQIKSNEAEYNVTMMHIRNVTISKHETFLLYDALELK